MTCLDETRVVDYVDGDLAAPERVEVEAHLGTCPSCRQLIAAMARGTGTGASALEADDPRAALAAGARVGRFEIVELLGRGGMGVVYRALDPVLGRSIALKLVRTRGPAATTEEARSRLAREARALAQLAHPNVVSVFELGVRDDDVYVAMEHVPGRNLREWLAEAPRSPGTILDALLAAGAGLAAAHAAGLVHRDVKPTNIVVGDDGRARMVDFGLVTLAGGAPGPEPGAEASAADATITRVGAVLGTPAYMAPEQHRGEPADARSDQFGFCATACDALTGRRPVAGTTPAEIASAIDRGDIEVPVELPPRLRRVLTRGLASAPDHRYPGMPALLADLAAAGRPPRWRRPLIAATVLVAILGGVAGMAWRAAGRPPDPCASADTALDDAWRPTRRDPLARAFATSRRPYAAAAAATVADHLDRYASRWTAARLEVCAATHVRHEQSEALLDLRMACLDRRRRVLAELVAVLVAPTDPTVVDGATAAVAGLPGLEACDDADGLRAVLALPDGVAARAEVAAIRDLLDRAQTRDLTGDYRGALAVVEPLADRATATGYEPVIAEVHLALGAYRDQAGDIAGAEHALRRAIVGAARGKHDRVAAEAWSLLITALGLSGRFDEARALIASAEAAHARADAAPDAEVRLLDRIGLLHSRAGDYEAARAFHDRALALAAQALGTSSPAYAAVLGHVGLNQWRRGDAAAARTTHQDLVALRRDQLGPSHPAVATALNNLGLVLYDLGDLDGARAAYAEAISIFEAALGPTHVELRKPVENLGTTYSAAGDGERAVALLERALAIAVGAYGTDHPESAQVMTLLAGAQWMAGQLDAADATYRQAYEVAVRVLGPDHPETGRTMGDYGGLLATRGKLEEAAAMMTGALAILERRLGPDHPRLAFPLTNLGELANERHRPAEARAFLERALVLRTATASDPRKLADTRMHLARALWDLGVRGRASELARAAAAAYRDNGGRDDELAALAAWMKARGVR